VAVLVDEFAEREAEATNMAAPAQSTHRIIAALDSLGYEPVELVLREDGIADWVSRLASEPFAFAFNLCETVGGRAEGEHLAAATVELLELPMTGARSRTLLYCLNKDRCAAMLRSHGIRVPDWMLVQAPDAPEGWDRFPAIVKPASDDASNGVHPDSVAHSPEDLYAATERIFRTWNAAVIQEFIEGREINLAIVGRHLLPPSEIDFSSMPEDAPPIVSFAAKWKAGSPEDLGTRPICPAPLDPEVARELQLLAARAWRIMEGRGYARVDVRLAADGTPYVIDINPNPDLSIDAGLARQARTAGWSYEELIKRIVEIVVSENGRRSADDDWVFMPPTGAQGEPT
jgi:D-alanine-D-alanine ligase